MQARKCAVIGVALIGITMLGQAAAEQPRTLKERLSDKASDQQRVDNCRVPIDRRGPVPRPDCPKGAQPDKAMVSAHSQD
jgi:hypothetical protein